MVPRLSGPMWKQPPRLIMLKIAILPPVAPKQKLQSKSFFGPPKHKKLIFSKNLNSVICPNIGGCFHIGPGDLGTIGPHKTIHLTKNRLLPTVCYQRREKVIKSDQVTV